MSSWPDAEGNSGGQLDGRLVRLLPALRRQLRDFLIGRPGQARQHVFETGIGFNTVQLAVGDERIHHRAALARFRRSEQQPVLFSDNGRQITFSTRLLSISTSPDSTTASSSNLTAAGSSRNFLCRRPATECLPHLGNQLFTAPPCLIQSSSSTAWFTTVRSWEVKMR